MRLMNCEAAMLRGELGRVGEQAPQVAIVEGGVVQAVMPPLPAVVLPQGLAQPRERVERLAAT